MWHFLELSFNKLATLLKGKCINWNEVGVKLKVRELSREKFALLVSCEVISRKRGLVLHFKPSEASFLAYNDSPAALDIYLSFANDTLANKN